ncbi:FtsK/SpoIIIE domain-containing protein [Cellulomonas sp. IC4_254]|uniref:FtsK/SpoIIIE domain-containing protein n=1 Tax=Cellulomonas sp. IC4_254 TaxID=2714040 RepID=UPI001421E9C3|nr:FtsK/SpoIIIE domain-containing protein [Cellulomonas sp. IC4_254]NHT17440.1 FHA domain-containing protein [Cellulomonas sp. IC4_254]
MRTRVVLRRTHAPPTPVTITTDATTTTGDLAEALVRADPQGAPAAPRVLRIHRPDDVDLRTLDPATSLSEAGFRAGSTIALASADHRDDGDDAPAVVRLVVVSGPDSGREVDLAAGTATIGRGPDCDLRLTDPQVSRLHARLLVGDAVEVVDAGSANGVVIGDGAVTRGVLRPDDILVLGGTELQVLVIDPEARTHTTGASGAVMAYNRSPRLVPRYAERTLPAPDVPTPPAPARFPALMLVGPVLMGAAMYAFTRNPMSLMFVALSPFMMVANWWNGRSTGRRKLVAETAAFRDGLDLLRAQVRADHETERQARLAEAPATRETVGAALGLAPVLWSARPGEPGFLALRVGTGTAPSRTIVEEPSRGSADAGLWQELQDALGELRDVDGVPHTVDLTDLGVLGVAGDVEHAVPVVRALLAQVACLHSPAEVVVAGLASRTSAPRWEWLSWLPHVDSPHSPLGAHLASSPAACATVVAQVEELIAHRRESSRSRGGPALPWVVLLVEDDAPAERGRLVRIAEEGLAARVVVVWRADTQRRLPASCRAVVVADERGARTGRTADGRWWDVTPETLDAETGTTLGRHLAGVTDAGALTLDESDLPRSAGYLALVGPEIAEDPDAVVERWHETGSVLDRAAPPTRRSSDAHLRGVVGQGTDGEFVLDLRSQGPHALVGGTTGAGKSEFLQAWVLGMAAAHSPDRVTFLFVDYKGGAAFADCVELPHCVGLVTDLAGHLVRRALTSLRAELRHREHLLAQAGAKDLLSLERTGDPRTPPALVIVVDEFAALVQEIPEFVDGVVDVAQRGRSLGLHLVLATQRPAGVIKDNLRANTNLRIALRMADEADSSDVLGSPVAAHFDPRIPGRGAVRTGPGRLAMFQTGYVGGRSDSAPPPVSVGIETLAFGPGEEWTVPPPPEALLERPADGPTDAARVVATLRRAAEGAGIPAPRRPWLDELPDVVALDTASGHTDGDLPLGLVDVPADQAQRPFRYRPDDDGSLAIYGTSGSGKSTTLRSIAVAAATAACHVRIYALDFAGGALGMLEALPQVGSVVAGSDTERIQRLLTELVAEIERRSTVYSAARADTLTGYRELSGVDDPRLFLLLDGLVAFRSAYEAQSTTAALVSQLHRVVAEGRAVGVHVAVTVEQPSGLPTSMASAVGKRLVLRQPDENASAQLGIPKDVFSGESPAGRAVLSGSSDVIQVATPGGHDVPVDQAAHVEALAAALAEDGAPTAPPVRRLDAVVPAADLPAHVGGEPVLGVADDSLAPIGFVRAGTFLVAGMSGSGRTTALITLAQALRRHQADAPLYYVGPRRSAAGKADLWDRTAARMEDIAAMARDLMSEFDVAHDDAPGSTLVIEGAADLVNTEADPPLLGLIRAARRNGHLVIAESETQTWTSSWPLVGELRAERRGIALQPDQGDGDSLFRTSFPRVRRTDFPVGRGLYVETGRARTVQLPRP